jgi:ribosome-associated protein
MEFEVFMEKDDRSRTQKKKADRALKKLGESLVALPALQLERLELDDELRQAIDLAKRSTRHGAKRRQMQYVGGLMREIDPAPIEQFLADIKRGHDQAVSAFKQIERWRDELVDGNDSLIEEILNRFSAADRQRLTQLVRSARKQTQTGSGQKPSRKLFGYLKEISAS